MSQHEHVTARIFVNASCNAALFFSSGILASVPRPKIQIVKMKKVFAHICALLNMRVCPDTQPEARRDNANHFSLIPAEPCPLNCT